MILARLIFLALLFMTVEASEKKVFVYHCNDNYTFSAEVSEDNAWLFLPKETLELSRAGNHYKNAKTLFSNKGWDANLSLRDKQYHCKNDGIAATWEKAKLKGVAFRAVGNEPGWILEIYSDEKVDFWTANGQDKTGFKIIEQHSNITSTEYKMASKYNTLFVRIEARNCQDTMVQRSYESTVYINFDGSELRGCGQALY